ncbi:MAG: cohesin domain-containing protein [Oscillospiraceae bacterium]|jgi:hypothetical protein|nr:cohesin domain-containing protein [Oscillospiraceae bacterium]
MLQVLGKHRRKIKILGISVVLVAVLLFSVADLREQRAAAGQTVIVTVTAASVDDLYGYQFQMNYDPEALEYTGTLTSHLPQIQTIFAKPFDGYQLVGATMVGEQPGLSFEEQDVCQMSFTARKNCVLSDALSVSDVGVVSSDLAYETAVSGWRCQAVVS